MEDNNFKQMEQLEYILLQLKAFTHTLDTIQSQFAIQEVGEEVVSSYVTLKHSINDIQAEVREMIREV